MARIPGQGVAASIGGPTTPGTATTEVQEQGVPSPPPGLHPPDFTNWSLPLLRLLRPGTTCTFRRSNQHRKTNSRPTGPGQQAPAPPMQAPSAPQGMLPVHQPRPRHPATPYQQVVQPPSQPATPYQQAVQPSRRPAGRGVAAQPPSDRATPAAGKHPRPWKAAGQGTGHQKQISQSPWVWARDGNQCSLDYTPGATQPNQAIVQGPDAPHPAMASIEVPQ